ncbi:hypothetical protein J2129_002019 [Methanofollis sp. W23]|nr:hypothetical protein [Methanofollis sp. W23]
MVLFAGGLAAPRTPCTKIGESGCIMLEPRRGEIFYRSNLFSLFFGAL